MNTNHGQIIALKTKFLPPVWSGITFTLASLIDLSIHSDHDQSSSDKRVNNQRNNDKWILLHVISSNNENLSLNVHVDGLYNIH